MSSQSALSEKDRKFREFSLNASAWKVILYVSLPLALYESLNQLFKILDSMMASHISSSAVSTIAYLSQLDMTLSAIGGGLAVGAGVKISEAYGAGDFDLVKKRVSTLYSLCAAVSVILLAVLLPFTEEFLKLAGTPAEFMADGVSYFRLDLIGMVIMFFNSVYISVERARGNSKRILYLNVIVITVKLFLTALFVYVFHMGIHMIATATIISQTLMFTAAAIQYLPARQCLWIFLFQHYPEKAGGFPHFSFVTSCHCGKSGLFSGKGSGKLHEYRLRRTDRRRPGNFQ